MRKIKKIINNISVNLLLLLVLLVFFLIILSILEMIGLASIPLLLSSILVTEGSESFVQLDFWNLKNILFELFTKDQVKFISIFIICLFLFKNIFHASIIFYQGRIIKSIKIYLSKKLFKSLFKSELSFFIEKKLFRNVENFVCRCWKYHYLYFKFIKFFKREVLILIAIVFLLFLSNVEITIFLFHKFFNYCIRIFIILIKKNYLIEVK